MIDFLSGNLSYRIEHHMVPDLPSNRLAEIGVRVRSLYEKFDLPYTVGPLPVQYFKSWRTIAKLSLPCPTGTCVTPPRTLQRPPARRCSQAPSSRSRGSTRAPVAGLASRRPGGPCTLVAAAESRFDQPNRGNSGTALAESIAWDCSGVKPDPVSRISVKRVPTAGGA